MYVLVFILSIGSGYVQVQAVNTVYSSLEDCKRSAVTIRTDLMNTRPSPNSNVFADCTEIPQEA